jgi:hypothetical protein
MGKRDGVYEDQMMAFGLGPVTVGGKTYCCEARCLAGFLGTSDPRVHFYCPGNGHEEPVTEPFNYGYPATGRKEIRRPAKAGA